MSRVGLAVLWLAVLAPTSGCVFLFDGSVEHRPEIQAELDPPAPVSSFQSTWQPVPFAEPGQGAVDARAVVEKIRGRLGGATKRVETAKQGPEPRPADVERTLDAWESWKNERGIAPIDLDPRPTPPPPAGERRGS